MSLRRPGPAAAGLLAATLAGCMGGLRQDPGTPAACPAVPAAPIAVERAPLLAGEFDLILVATTTVAAEPAVEPAPSGRDTSASRAAEPRWALGRLSLRPAGPPPPEAPSDPLGGPPPAFIGWTEIELGRVGAVAPGRPDARDSAAPGVGAYLLDPAATGEADPAAEAVAEPAAEQGAEPTAAEVRVIVRLGAEANRRDRVRFDGAHTTLTAGSIGPSGFAGSWTSAAGGAGASGHFCARRR